MNSLFTVVVLGFLLICAITDQFNLITAFYTGTQNAQNTFRIGRSAFKFKCDCRLIFHCFITQISGWS